MGSEIISQQLVLWDGYNLTTDLFSVVLDLATDALDNTTLGDDTRSNAPGLQNPAIQIEGYYDAVRYDTALASTIGGKDKLISWIHNDVEGARAYFLKAMHGSYEPVKASTGELAGFSAGGMASKGDLIRGRLLRNASNLTATGTGTGQELGAVSSGQSLFAGLHVFAIDDNAGDTLDLTIQSDDNSGFTSASNRITFDQVTDIGSQFKSLAGPITDDWYRASYTIAGSTPAFGAIVVIGIQ